jgi:hypothetical protein
MKQIAENLWLKGYPLSVLGTRHGRNVTVIRLSTGKLIIHSMAPFPAADVQGIHAIGDPSWLVESMLLHDTYARQGREIFPDIPFLGPPGFGGIVKFPVEPLHPAPEEWAGEVETIHIKGAPKVEEIAILHIPSRTLILADLIFNFPSDEKGWDRFFHRYIAGFKRYPGMSRIFRIFVTDREAFRRSIDELVSRDFDRIIVGHGNLIETSGKELLIQALRDAGLY